MSKPKHHVRDSVCASRPPYREGRKAKAVKVYTVQQESQYLLVQGIPAVGATKDLLALLAAHGDIAEHRMLDDYPAEQFTDVCLVKYQKIQSARHAKRRLDDWSFFGGVLHVCYAPEYETVRETREKLQDRRRVIAAKVRQYSQDGTYEQNYDDSMKGEKESSDFHKASSFHQNAMVTQDTAPPGNMVMNSEGTGASLMNCLPHNSIMERTEAIQPAGFQTWHRFNSVSTIDNRNQATGINHMTKTPKSFSFNGPGASQSNEILGKRVHSHANQQFKSSNEGEQLWLPPPPKQTKLSQRPPEKQAQPKFALGPSAQASFPPDFDARTDQPSGVTLHQYLAREGPNAASKDVTTGTTTKSAQEKIEESLKSSEFVIKTVQKKSTIPRFIPRQTHARFKPKSSQSLSTTTSTDKSMETVKPDTLNAELKKNAFRLGVSQGPEELEEHSRMRPDQAEVSVLTSVRQIREKLSKVTKVATITSMKDG